MGVYAEIRNGTITNTVVCDAGFATQFGLIEIDSLTPMPGVGWTTPDGGTTWAAPAVPVSATNQQSLQQKAQAALATNATYLGLASPTTAQAVAQVAVLTRECSAVIRLLLGLLDSTSGT